MRFTAEPWHIEFTLGNMWSAEFFSPACSSVTAMEQYLLQQHTASAMITIKVTVLYFPTFYCHGEVPVKCRHNTITSTMVGMC